MSLKKITFVGPAGPTSYELGEKDSEWADLSPEDGLVFMIKVMVKEGNLAPGHMEGYLAVIVSEEDDTGISRDHTFIANVGAIKAGKIEGSVQPGPDAQENKAN